jgi:hypothetical protein
MINFIHSYCTIHKGALIQYCQLSISGAETLQKGRLYGALKRLMWLAVANTWGGGSNLIEVQYVECRVYVQCGIDGINHDLVHYNDSFCPK